MKQKIIRYEWLVVFIGGMLFCAVLYTPHRFLAWSDEYYHAGQGQLLRLGEPLASPFLTILRDAPDGIYSWYHYLLGYSQTIAASLGSTDPLHVGTQGFHVFIFGLGCTIVFILIRKITKSLSILSSRYAAYLAVIVFTLSSSVFTYRFADQRPQALAIICFLLIWYGITQNRLLITAGAAFLGTYFYSLPIMYLSPLGIFLAVSFFSHPRNMEFGYRHTLAGLFGFTLGVVTHPQPLAYLSQSFGVQLTSLFFSSMYSNWKPLELVPFSLVDLHKGFELWVPLSIFLCTSYILYIRQLSTEKRSILITALLFGIGTLYTRRMIEYAIPALALSIGILAEIPEIRENFKKMSALISGRSLKIAILAFFFILLTIMQATLVRAKSANASWLIQTYQPMLDRVRELPKGSKILLPDPGFFGKLVAQQIPVESATGIDLAFVFLKNRDVYRDIVRVTFYPGLDPLVSDIPSIAKEVRTVLCKYNIDYYVFTRVYPHNDSIERALVYTPELITISKIDTDPFLLIVAPTQCESK